MVNLNWMDGWMGENSDIEGLDTWIDDGHGHDGNGE